MRISGLELIEIRIPLKRPFVTHRGVRAVRRILLVRVEGSEGQEGWGECAAGEEPSYTYETTETARHILQQFLLPHLVDREIGGPEDLRRVSGPIRGHPMAKAAAEGAIWDLQAKELQVPLWELLGGSRTPVPVGVSLGLHSDLDELVETVGACVARGYARIKLKIQPGHDIDPVRRVRDHFPSIRLSVDANGSYGLEDTEDLKKLDGFGLLLIEQPLGYRDLADHARLQGILSTPICLDESIRGEEDVHLALELGACRVVTVKPAALGGLTSARTVHDLCQRRAVPAWVGGMLESGIGRAHNLALATLPAFHLPGDLSESSRYLESDIVNAAPVMVDGRMLPLEEPGIGIRPDRERIRALAVASEIFGRVKARVVCR